MTKEEIEEIRKQGEERYKRLLLIKQEVRKSVAKAFLRSMPSQAQLDNMWYSIEDLLTICRASIKSGVYVDELTDVMAKAVTELADTVTTPNELDDLAELANYVLNCL